MKLCECADKIPKIFNALFGWDFTVFKLKNSRSGLEWT